MTRIAPVASASLALLVLAGAAHAQTGPFTGSAALDLSAINFAPGDRTDFPLSVTDAGVVTGLSTVRTTDGRVAIYSWLVEPGQPATRLGLNGTDYNFPDGIRYDAAQASVAGRTIGASSVVGSELGLGADAWLFDGQATRRIGPTLAQLSQTPETAFALANSATKINSQGVVLGSSFVYRGDGAHFSTSWVINDAGEFSLLVPPGEGFINPSSNAPTVQAYALNESGTIVGSELKWVEGFPNVAFIRNQDGTYREVGLTGAPYEDPAQGIFTRSSAVAISENGITIGGTLPRVEGEGTGVWVDDGTTTTEVGLRGPLYFGPGGAGSQSLFTLSSQGVAVGVAYHVGSDETIGGTPGQSMFVVRNGATEKIGLSTGAFVSPTGWEYNAPFTQTSDGTVLGFAATTAVSTEGQALKQLTSWAYDPSRAALGTVPLALQGSQYVGPEGERLSYTIDAKDGRVIGISRLFTGVADEDFWYDGFIANLDTGEITKLSFETAPDGRSRTYPLIVTDRGGVFGYYTKFENGQPAGDRPFYWSPRAGYVDLQPAGAPPLEVGSVPTFVVSPDGLRVAISGTLLTGDPGLLRVVLPTEGCDSIDFNNDGLFPSDDDLVSFLTVLAGGSCGATLGDCNDIDFNNDGLFPSDDDLIAYLRVLAGGNC